MFIEICHVLLERLGDSEEAIEKDTDMTDLAATPLPARQNPLLWPLLASLLILGWSSGFVGIRYANAEASVALLLFWRTLLAGVILLPFALTIGPRLRLRAVLGQAGFGVLSVFLYLGGFALAIEQRVPTGLVALIADLLPLAIAVLSWPVLGERLSRAQKFGTGVAVAGVLMVSADSLSLGQAPAWAYGITVASMLVFALASVLHRGNRDSAMPVHQSLCIHCLTGAALFGLCSWGIGDGLMPPLTRDFAIGMVWLVFVGTFLAYSVYYTSLRLFPAAKVSAAIYLSPPVTMLWAHGLFGDPLTPVMLAGLGVTLAGVWIAAR